ncbi:MAG: hypothetical protein ACYCQJ_14145 [Nitrososphaerales archaeon]
MSLELEERIFSEYYAKLPVLTNGKYEFEVRFGQVKDQKITPGLDRNTFLRLRDTLLKLSGIKFQKLVSTDFLLPSPKGERVRFTREREPEQREYLLRKNQVKIPLYVPNYGFYLTVSTEVTTEEHPPLEGLPVREKERWSMIIPSFPDFRIDLTIVVQLGPYQPQLEICGQPASGKQASQVSYELEVELTNPYFDPKQLKSLLANLVKELQNTRTIYSYEERDRVFSEVNALLGRNGTSLDSRSLVQLRTLKLDDLRTGMIIPSPRPELTTVSQQSTEGVSYSVTIKADGKRKLLYIGDSGIYLIYYPQEMDKILGKIPGYQATFQNYFGTIVEGEYLPDTMVKADAPPGLRLLMYDCLAITGDPTIRNFPHLERVKKLYEIETHFSKKIKKLALLAKEFYPFRTAPEFFGAVSKVLDKNYWFETDGCIFTPNAPYDISKLFLPAAQRKLATIPEVIKWKPLSLTSIDFKIQRRVENGKIVIVLLSGNDEEFKGTAKYPYNNKISLDSTLEALPDGTIGEFLWNDSLGFKLFRVRTDKLYPNSTPVALDIWQDLNEPLTEDTLRGKGDALVKKYLSRFRTGLYEYLKDLTVLFFGAPALEEVVGINFTKLIIVDPRKEEMGILNKSLKNSGKPSSLFLADPSQREVVKQSVLKSLGAKPQAMVFLTISKEDANWYMENLLDRPGQTLDFGLQLNVIIVSTQVANQEFFLPETAREQLRSYQAVLGKVG